MPSLGEAVVDVGANTAPFETETKKGVNSALASASKSVENFGKKMTSVGKSLTAKVTLPIVGIGAAAVKTAGDFEQTMNIFQAATGATGPTLDKLRQQAIQLGADTVFSANEAADAMLELGRAGQTTAQISSTLPQVLNLAATEGLGLADSAGIVTSALAQFGLEAGKSGEVVNALAGASNASRSSVASLSESFKLVGSAASGIGLSVQETAGALAALSQAGLDGSIAGTSLASVFNRLVPTTKKAQKAMASLNLDFTNADGSFKSMDQIAGQLQKTFQGMDAETRKIRIGEIFGRDASTIAAVNALVATGAKGIRDYTKAASDQSSAQLLAEARMKGINGAVEQMKGSLETAALVIGQALIPVIQKIAVFIGDMAEKFTKLNPSVQRTILVIAGIAAAIGPLLLVIGSLVAAVGAIGAAFGGLTLAAAAPALLIAGLVAAFTLFMVKSKAARKVVVDAFGQIKAAVLPAVEEISSIFTSTLIPAFQDMWPVIEKIGVIILKVFAGAAVNAIKGAIDVLVGFVKIVAGVVKILQGIFTGDFSRIWEGLKQVVSGAIQAILGVVRIGLSTGLGLIFSTAFAVVQKVVSAAWGKIKTMFSAAIDAIGSAISTVIDVLSAPFRVAFAFVANIIRSNWDTISNIFMTAVNVIGTILKTALNIWLFPLRIALALLSELVYATWQGVSFIFTTAINGIATIMSTLWGVVSTPVLAVFNFIRGVISGMWSAILAIFSTAIGTIKTVFSAGFNALKGIVSSVFNAVRSTVGVGIRTIVSLVKGVPGKIGALAGNFLEAGAKLGKSVITGLGNGLKKTGGFLADIGNAIRKKVNSILHLPITLGKGPLKFTIPAFATGTNFAPGGPALVGERGPELIELPRGSKVHTASETRRLASPMDSLGTAGEVALSEETLMRLAQILYAMIMAGSRQAVDQNNLEVAQGMRFNRS